MMCFYQNLFLSSVHTVRVEIGVRSEHSMTHVRCTSTIMASAV